MPCGRPTKQRETSLFKKLQQSRALRQRLAASRDRLYRVAYAWCHDRHLADDLTQQALVQGLRKLHQLRDPELLETWLFRILNNCWKDHFRRQRDQEPLVEERHFHHQSPERLHDGAQLVVRVRNAIETLPAAQREVVTLVDLTELSYAQVADVLDIPIGTVMSRLCRGRRALRDQLMDLAPACETSAPRLRSVR